MHASSAPLASAGARLAGPTKGSGYRPSVYSAARTWRAGGGARLDFFKKIAYPSNSCAPGAGRPDHGGYM